MTKVVKLADAARRTVSRPSLTQASSLTRVAFDQQGHVVRAQDADPQVRVWLAEVVTDGRVINEDCAWQPRLRFQFRP